ncbi:MAG: 3-deoxy-D-manno-octulosonic acid transferase [Rhodospirillales bacterium]|nr:3-deoxy-D-manno-octulosonic acid transferase [Rhodospirillales bacterium]MDE2573941.1 3-deoxy-D-manno-octulosonic acid transferase [Rhodospirillales bacterium]
MLRAAYATATTLAAPALRLLLARRARRGKEIAARLPERRGIDPTPRPPGRLIWLHAASVGETLSVLPVIAALTGRAEVLVTTGTVTSAALLAQRLGADPAGIRHRFVPLDVPGWVARFLDHWRPDAAGFVESEIWPNLILACARRRIPLMLVNARLSPGSAAGWHRVPRFAHALFGRFTRLHAQSPADAGRLAALGAPAPAVIGNLKYAAAPLPADDAELARLRARLAGRPIWLAASIHPGEDAAMRAVHDALLPAHPGLLTILAPRHPERGAAMAAALAGRRVTRRGGGEDPPDEAGFWIADTLGELGLLYRLVGHAFIGRSLDPATTGGQNPLEPARLGCAIAIGPHVENFADIVAELAAGGALARVADTAELAAWVGGMIDDPARRRAMGEAGRRAASRTEDLPARIATDLLALAGA